MFSYETIPTIVGWIGAIFKIIPIFLAVSLTSFMIFINLTPSDVGMNLIDWISALLNGVKYEYREYYNFEYFQQERLFNFYAFGSITAVLFILLSADILLIRGANARNYKKIIPGTIVYGISFIQLVFFTSYAEDEFKQFGKIMSVFHGTVFMSLVLSVNKFYSESKAIDAKKKYNENISYVKFDSEKV